MVEKQDILAFLDFVNREYGFTLRDSSSFPEMSLVSEGELDNCIAKFFRNPTNLPEDLVALQQKANETGMWFPECFYFMVKHELYDGDDISYPIFSLITKWEWEDQQSNLAEEGYHNIHVMFEQKDPELFSSVFDHVDGIFFVERMTEYEIRDRLTKMGMTEKPEILNLFPYLE